jgi:histidine kinase
MSLAWKFFLSYLAVVAVGLFVLALSTALVAPLTFSRQMGMMDMGDGGYMGGGNMMGMQDMQGYNAYGPGRLIDDQLNQAFRGAVNSALWKAGIAATLAAVILSAWVSRRIVRPLRQVAGASQHIAEGHYDQRLSVQTSDELGHLIASFNRMAAALAETEAMRRQLIADVSHELKTPLASIKGYMEGLQDGVIAPTPETFQLLYQEADRLQRLVHDLQELSHAEATSLQLEARSCDPAELVGPVTTRLQPQFADKGVTLKNNLPLHLPAVRADVDRVEQVLTNLLGNALQYTPAGGLVMLQAAPVDSVLQFSVQDTGIGLDAEDRARVFQRFYRVDKSRSRASGGSGIGLTIARHIVEAHGGRIWAESSGCDQGSTFLFTLPLA